ncbi:MAG: TetR/AcrR family transcriptional regulator [Vicinamibacterales bacterium]
MNDESTAPSKEDVVAEFRRRSFVEAARRVFGERGFEQATMDAIAEAAGVAKGTLYLYYPSKQAIHDATFAADMAAMEALITERVGQATTAREAIEAFVTVRTEYFQQHPDFFRIYVAEIAREVATGTSGRVCTAAVDRQTRSLQSVIEKAVAAGDVRVVDPEAVALAVFDMSKGLVGRRLLIGSRSTVERDAGFLTDLIWAGLAPDRGSK